MVALARDSLGETGALECAAIALLVATAALATVWAREPEKAKTT